LKNNRLSLILEIIDQMEIETQDELAAELKKRGMDVTQATVSRDIKELRLIKVPSEKGGYKYSVAVDKAKDIPNRMKKLFAQSVLSIRSSNNILVIKTMTGSANTAAAVLDSLNSPHILGSVAGDDTIFIVVENSDKVPEVEALLRDLLKRGG